MKDLHEEIYKTIDIVVNERLKKLEYDKTEKGEVVSIGDYECQVRINGEIFTCKIKENDKFNVGDIVYVNTPKSKDHERYAVSGSVRLFEHIKYSDDGGETFTENNGNDEGIWRGTHVSRSRKSSLDPDDYEWIQIKGIDGQDGEDGKAQSVWIRYSNFQDGGAEDGQFEDTDIESDTSRILWIRYSEYSDGRSMTTNPKNTGFIGVARNIDNTPPTEASEYTWSKRSGLGGIKFEGSYVHIKYSDDKGKNFTANYEGIEDGETLGVWIGIYTDKKERDSNFPSDYSWNRVITKDTNSERIWVRYSQYQDGRNMSTDPQGMEYVGLASNDTGLFPTQPEEYVWSKIQGTGGVKSGDNYVHIKYSNDGGKTFTQPSSGERIGDWIGVYVDEIVEDSSNPAKYRWEKTEGNSRRIWVQYSEYNNGGAEDGSNLYVVPTDKNYVGIAINTDNAPPIKPKDYVWVAKQHNDGIKIGNEYIHIKYSNDNGISFTKDENNIENGETLGKWIGTYIDSKIADSNVPLDYEWNKVFMTPHSEEMQYIGVGLSTNGIAPRYPISYEWSKIHGEDGEDGEPGVGIEEMIEWYLASSLRAGVTIEGYDWKNKVQTTNKTDPYLWNYESIIYTDGTQVDTEPKIIGTYSESGVGISSIENFYFATDSSKDVTRNTTGWTPSVQTIDSKNKRYLWNYEVVYYTNGTSAPTDPVIIGIAGTDGYNGKDAVVGVLTNDTYVVPASEAGWVEDYTDINTEMQIFYGTINDTENWTFRVPYSENMNGYLVGNKYQVEYVSSLSGGYVEIEAKREGFPTIRKKFTVALGRKGKDAVTYWLELSTNYLKENTQGTSISPNVINVKAMQRKGNGIPTPYKGRITVSESSTGSAYSWAYVPTVDEDSITFSPKLGKHSIRFSLYTAGTNPRNERPEDLLDAEYVIYLKDGEDGTTITDVEEFYLAYPYSSGVSVGTTGWESTVPTLDKTNKYLWNYEKITYSKSEPYVSIPVVIGTFSTDGVGITGVTEYYLISNEKTGITVDNIEWSTIVPTPDEENKYLWNYSVTTYSDKRSVPTTPVIIGIHGKDGKDGVDGKDGEPGEDGVSTYVWIKYSNKSNGGSNDGTEMYDDPGDRSYIGIFNTAVYTSAPNNPALYSWSKYKGEDGKPGKPGDPGQPAYIHIKYSSLPQGGFSNETMFDDPDGREYVGIMNSDSPIPSETPSDYKWSKIQGDKGVPGDSNYTHIRYSDNGSNFTGNGGRDLGAYIGISISDESDGPENFDDYAWTRLEGREGRGVTSINQQYYLSTSDETQVGGEWIDDVPPYWEEEHYMWTRSKIIYNQDPKEVFTDPILSDIENRLNTVTVDINQAKNELETKVSLGDVKTSFAIGLGWAKLSADRIDIEGAVNFSSLSTNVQESIAQGQNAENTINGLLTPGKTTIDGGKITTNSIKTDSLITTTLSAIEAQLGDVVGGSITSTTLTSGTITGGSINSTNGKTKINLDNGTFTMGDLSYNGSKIKLKGDIESGSSISGSTITGSSFYSDYNLTDRSGTMSLTSDSLKMNGNFKSGTGDYSNYTHEVVFDPKGVFYKGGRPGIGDYAYRFDKDGAHWENYPGGAGVDYVYGFGIKPTGYDPMNMEIYSDPYGSDITINPAQYLRFKKKTYAERGLDVTNGLDVSGTSNFQSRVNANNSLFCYGNVYMGGSYVNGHISEVGGNNSNWYIKFTNGVMIARMAISFTTSGASVELPSVNTSYFSYPASFSAVPVAFVNFDDFSEFVGAAVRIPSTTRTTFRIYHKSTTGGVTKKGSAFIVGRWKTITNSY